VLKRRLVRKPESDISRVLLASVYGHMGNFEESRAEWAEALRINPDYSLEHRRKTLPYKNPADFEHLLDGLRKADLAK
jgi:tetratricopeptide (TPR) repeat protein